MNEGKIPWIVGSGTIVFGVLLGILVVLFSDNKVSVIGSVPVVTMVIMAGVFLCLDGRNRKLTVEDAKLCYRNWIGRQTSFSLEEISYCKTALEKSGGKDYLKLYDQQGKKLCKLEYNMKNCAQFLQYLLDNQVRLDCSQKSDLLLKSMLQTTQIATEQITAQVNEAYDSAKEIIEEWIKEHPEFGAGWKMGIVSYLSDSLSNEMPLWEQESYTPLSMDELPEGYLIVIEGYLQKDGEFVISKKDRAVAFCIPLIGVSQSYQIGEQLKIRYFGAALEELKDLLDIWAHILPVNRYHTGMISIRHDLKERI